MSIFSTTLEIISSELNFLFVKMTSDNQETSTTSNRVALVTGGNGGIGLAMSKAIGEAGATVVIAGRNEEKNSQSIKKLESLNIKCKSLIVDVVNEESCNLLVDNVISHFGKLNILVNNAGTNIRKRPEEYHLDEWKGIIDTNLISMFTCSKASFKHFKRCCR